MYYVAILSQETKSYSSFPAFGSFLAFRQDDPYHGRKIVTHGGLSANHRISGKWLLTDGSTSGRRNVRSLGPYSTSMCGRRNRQRLLLRASLSSPSWNGWGSLTPAEGKCRAQIHENNEIPAHADL